MQGDDLGAIVVNQWEDDDRLQQSGHKWEI